LNHGVVSIGLLPSLRRAGTTDSPSRIIMVSSEMAVTAAAGLFGSEPFHPSLNENYGEGDLRGEFTRASTDGSDGLKPYGRAKLCNILFCFELNRRLAGRNWPVIVHALHPGGVLTRTSNQEVKSMFLPVPGLSWLVSKFYMPLLWRSPDTGSRTLLYAALGNTPEYMKRGGLYLNSMGRPVLPDGRKPDDKEPDHNHYEPKTIHPPWNKHTLTIYKPWESLQVADQKWSRRLWNVSLSLMEKSPARSVVDLAP